MTYETYRYIYMGGLIMAIIMLLLALFLFFYFKIPKVIGDLTGATARKAIENIRNQNESSGDKTHGPSDINKERGKLTDKISQSGRLIKGRTDSLGGMFKTAKIGTQQLSPDSSSNETTVLSGMNETTILNYSDMNETTVLNYEGMNETTVLNNNSMNETQLLTPINVTAFVIEKEITFIHSYEEIA